MAKAEQREVVWTKAAQADLQAIYEFNISLLGEEQAYELVESVRQKADVLYQPIIGSTPKRKLYIGFTIATANRPVIKVGNNLFYSLLMLQVERGYEHFTQKHHSLH